jgi:hypothetical protein
MTTSTTNDQSPAGLGQSDLTSLIGSSAVEQAAAAGPTRVGASKSIDWNLIKSYG